MWELWRRLTSNQYVRALEAEVARLREENRALMNSILGIAGVPPIQVQPPNAERDAHAGSRPVNSAARQTSRPVENAMTVAAPMRRRSWPQIHRALEWESAKQTQKQTESAVSLPVAQKTKS